MARPLGRGIQIVAGILLIVLGFWRGTSVRTIAGVLGFVPLLAGAFNGCVLALLIGTPFEGGDALKS